MDPMKNTFAHHHTHTLHGESGNDADGELRVLQTHQTDQTPSKSFEVQKKGKGWWGQTQGGVGGGSGTNRDRLKRQKRKKM